MGYVINRFSHYLRNPLFYSKKLLCSKLNNPVGKPFSQQIPNFPRKTLLNIRGDVQILSSFPGEWQFIVFRGNVIKE